MTKRLKWIDRARPNQLPPQGDWRIWMILAGRGWGKTKTAAEDCWDWGWENPNARIAVVAATAKDLRETMLEGPSGILSSAPREIIASYNKSFSEVKLINGTQINGYSAEEPERLRGPNFGRAYCDELASWQRPESWDMLNFALRIGDRPQVIITTTPKPTKLIDSLVRDSAKAGSGVILTTGSTYENQTNLAPGFLAYLREKYEGSRLGRQEIHAEILSDVPGALWNRTLIEALRVTSAPEMRRIVVAIDPAVSTKEGSDETGIVVAGHGRDGQFYVLDDDSGSYPPEEWARRAVALFNKHKADRIVAEANNGGDMVDRTIRVVAPNVPIKLVHASRGKAVRAEPISALYEQGRAHHVNSFPTLEDQMCQFTSDYDRAKMGYSPDRLDALVWAVTDLMEKKVGFFS